MPRLYSAHSHQLNIGPRLQVRARAVAVYRPLVLDFDRAFRAFVIVEAVEFLTRGLALRGLGARVPPTVRQGQDLRRDGQQECPHRGQAADDDADGGFDDRVEPWFDVIVTDVGRVCEYY